MTGTFLLFSQEGTAYLYAAAVCFGIGNGIMWPSYLSILAKTGDSDTQGSIQGIANSFGSFASIIGLITGGFVLNLLVEKTYYLSAGILLLIAVCGFYLISIRKKLKVEPQTE